MRRRRAPASRRGVHPHATDPLWCRATGLPPMTGAHFEPIVAVMPDAVVITDRDGVIQFVNAAARDLLGKGDEELIGKLTEFSIRDGEASEIEAWRGDGRR